MRTGFRLVFVALAGSALVLAGTAPVARAEAGNQPSRSGKGPKVPALLSDVARIEPLAAGPTVELKGVGEYRGLLEVRRVGGGVGAVNEVALDDYLKGISEVPSSWPPEALRAQAIAARTYLLWVLGNTPAGEAAALGAQICATESCQVYSGLAKERARNGDRWVAAVRDTAGLALLSGGSPILAKYSSCNGGRSVSGGKPYLKAVDDPDDARCPLHRWGLTVSYDDVGRALAVPGPVKAVRATSGDIVVDWSGDGAGGRVTVPRTEFRAKVGAAVPPPPDRSRTVPSILFTLRPDDAARVAVLDGRGYGHGIGMSQWGAYGKALRGMKAPAILAAYYGGIRPTRVAAGTLPGRVRVVVDSGKPPAKPAPPPAETGQPGGRSAGAPAPGGAAAAAKGGKPKAGPAGRPEAVVSASGPFRILDSKGKVVVPVATGPWRVVPSGRGVRLVPPRDQAGAPGLTVLGVEPASPLPGQPLTVRFKSNLPALVSVTAQPPAGPAVTVLERQVAGTEEQRLTLPSAARPGTYSVTLTADAGPARTATVTITPAVADPAAAAATSAGPPGAPALLGEIPAALHQTLLLGGDLGPRSAGDRQAAAERASRSSSRRTDASPSAADPVAGGVVGALLAALAGLAVWRFRSGHARPAQESLPSNETSAVPTELAPPDPLA